MNTQSNFLYAIATICCLFLLSGCKNVSYLNAYYHNNDRFTGAAKKDAFFMIDLQDDLILAQDISELARTRAYSKGVYNFADSASYDYKGFMSSLKFLSVKKKVKMPNAVSEKNHEIYNKVFAITSKNGFDKIYLETLSGVLSKMAGDMEKYLSDGEDLALKELITKNLRSVKSHQKKVERLVEEVQVASHVPE